MGAVRSLGDWRLRPTAILRRERGRLSQLLLLLPPPGFTGRARLSVIGAGRREEFLGVWESGCSPEIPAELCPHLERLTARHFAPVPRQGSTQQVAPIPETPAVFAVPVGAARARQPVHANLLLELMPTDEHAAAHPQSAGTQSGPLTFPRARSGAAIYLVPILWPAAAGAAAPPADHLAAALERDRNVRLCAHAQDLALPDEPALRRRIAEEVQSGRLEPLLIESAPGVGATERWPFPAHTALITRDDVSLDDEFPVARDVENLLIVPPAADLLRTLSPRREIGTTLRLETAYGDRLTHVAHPLIGLDPFQEAVAPYAAALWSQILRESLRLDTPRISGFPRTRRLGLCLLFFTDPRLPARLGRNVKRWNKQHSSPRLVLATASDYFALVAEIERRGFLYRRARG